MDLILHGENIMKILFENKDFLVCEKSVGISTQSTPDASGLADIVSSEFGYAAVINRLDTAVGGAVLIAKNKSAASEFSKLAENRLIDKTYLAVVEGIPENKSGIYEDLLFKDSSKNKSFVVKRMRKGVKKASLAYELISTAEYNGKTLSLVRIKLHTGRTHQIRVQFSSRMMPLCGDGKYGSRDNGCTVALWSHMMEFELGEKFSVCSYPDMKKYPWNLFWEMLNV